MAEVAEWRDQVDGFCQVRRVLDKSKQDRSVDEAEQIAVILGITPVYAGLFRCTAFSRAVGSGGDLIPPLWAWVVGQCDTVAGTTIGQSRQKPLSKSTGT